MSDLSAPSLIANLYARAQSAMEGLAGAQTPPSNPASGTPNFPASLDAAPTRQATQAPEDFLAALREAENTVKAGLTGRADPQSVVMALAATELAVETAVTLRDRVVEAYQEILRMPV